MKGIWLGRFYYSGPSEAFGRDGRRAIVRSSCVGPIEAQEYGVTKDGEYYFDYTYAPLSEEELEHDFQIIGKERMRTVLDGMIGLFERNDCAQTARALERERLLLDEE